MHSRLFLTGGMVAAAFVCDTVEPIPGGSVPGFEGNFDRRLKRQFSP